MAIARRRFDAGFHRLQQGAADHRHALLHRRHARRQLAGAEPGARATMCAPCSISTTARCCGACRARPMARRALSPNDGVTQHLQAILPQFDLIVGTEEEFMIAGGGDGYHGLAAGGARRIGRHAGGQARPAGLRGDRGRRSPPAWTTPTTIAASGGGAECAGCRRRLLVRLPERLAARRGLRGLLPLRQWLRRAGGVAPWLRAGHAVAGRSSIISWPTPTSSRIPTRMRP